MNVFRRISTIRLLALVGVLAAVVLITSVALARGRSGPRPPHRPLAAAIHNALAVKPVSGFSARISFTDHLLPSGTLSGGGGSALLNGTTGRVWLSNDGRFRLELQSEAGDTQIMGDSSSVRVFDASQAVEYVLPISQRATGHESSRQNGTPSVQTIERALARVAGAVNMTGAVPGDIAGRPVYSVRLSPKQDGGLLGGVQLAWDASRGVPLKVAVYARGQSSPVLALTATDVHYGTVSSSDLVIHPAAGTKVTRVSLPSSSGIKKDGKSKHAASVSGVAAVARRLPFHLSAPRSLAARRLKAVRLVSAGGQRSAMLVYGEGLSAIVVLEQPAGTNAPSRDPLAALPGVSVNGASGRELATALGTLLRYQRGGVSYTLVGSVPASIAESAARALS